MYKNCSECQKQFLYTTCSPQVWAWNFPVLNLWFNEQSVIILWVSWCKNKSFWQRFTCLKKIEENIFLASFSSGLPSRVIWWESKTEASSPLKSRWFFKPNLNSDYKSTIDKVFHSRILFMGPGFLKFSLKWNVGYGGNKCCHTFGKKHIQVILFEIDCAIFYTNLHEVFCQFISWTNWVNSSKFMDNCWISCQVMADMKKVYDDLMIINLYMK